MNRVAAFLIVAVVGFQNANASISVQDFISGVTEHRERVLHFALAAYKKFPEHFTAINEGLIKEHLEYHDLPKIFDLPELNRWGYQHPLTIAERLAEWFGVNKNRMSLVDRSKFMSVVYDLNTMERHIKQEARHELTSEQVAQLDRVELWADITDTGIFRAVEMGHGGGVLDGAVYLRSRNDKVGGKVAAYLGLNYERILNFEKASCVYVFAN